MKTQTPLTKEQALEMAERACNVEAHRELFNRWLARGDGMAFYENKAGDSSKCGHVIVMSFGSPAALIETEEAPEQMPDTGKFSTPWAYRLVGTYKGEAL